MKHIVILLVCMFLLSQCRKTGYQTPSKTFESFSIYDTLGLDWLVLQQEHVVYYFQDEPSVNINWTLEYAVKHENAYTQIDDIFKAQLPQKMRFFVWTNDTTAEQKLGSPLGFAVPQKCLTHSYYGQTLGHEMTHILSYWAGGIPPTKQTKFVNEGVAVAFDLRGNDKIAEAKAALAGYNVQSIKDFWVGGLQEAPDEVFYPVAGAFMEYLYQQNMHDEFMALIKNQTFEDAEYIYGPSKLNSLIADFDSKLGL